MLSLVSDAPLPYITITRLVMGMGDGKREGDRETSKREQNGVHKTSSPIVAWSHPDFCDFIYHHIYREIIYEDTHRTWIIEKSLPIWRIKELFFDKGQHTEVPCCSCKPGAPKSNQNKLILKPLFYIYVCVCIYVKIRWSIFFAFTSVWRHFSEILRFFAFHTH